MFKDITSALDFAKKFKDLYALKEGVEVAVCAPYLQLKELVAEFAGSGIMVGAQNCHFEDEGAYTGEIAVPMLEEIGVDCCIIGHSERREYFAESDAGVNKKLGRLLQSDIRPIVCVGERLEQREAGKEYDVVKVQTEVAFKGISGADAAKAIIAYEPVWAIGTGKTATADQAQDMCAFIRGVLAGLYGSAAADKVLIQYGGSVKPGNASEILNMPDIDGALVGGASLKAESFIEIINF